MATVSHWMCVIEGEREQSRECKRRRTSAVPHASCSMYSAHSSQLGFLQSENSVPARRASQQHGASTWPCQLPGPVAWVNKGSYKTNMGGTRTRICSFTQGNNEYTGIYASDIGSWAATGNVEASSVQRRRCRTAGHMEMDISLQNTQLLIHSSLWSEAHIKYNDLG